MTGIDIGLFDYDRHNTLYYFIMNADEHIYFRYGGRDETSPTAYLDLSSIEIALKLGLEQHSLYNEGKIEKQKRSDPFYPRYLSLLRREVIDRGRCVECHLIADFEALEKELNGELSKLEDMYLSPDIKTIGIHLDIPKGLVVKNVDGAVKKGGMEPKDLIVGFNGKQVFTFGDFQYFYNKIPRNSDQIRITVDRNGVNRDLTVILPKEWWWTDLYHRYWSIEPILFFKTTPLTIDEKKKHGFNPEGFASTVNWIYEDAKKRGFIDLNIGDIIYSVDGVEVDELTRNFETHVKLNTTAGTTFTSLILRNGKRFETKITSGRQRYRK